MVTKTPVSQNRELIFLKEPRLEFRFAQKTLDPKAGLSIFGPYDTDLPSHPRNISYAIIGTRSGIELTTKFISKVQAPITPENVTENPQLWPLFPGFQVVYYCSLPSDPTRTYKLDENKLTSASSALDPNKRAFDVVNQYLEGIQHLTEPDDLLDAIICAVPDTVYRNCRPRSYVRDGTGERVSFSERKMRAQGQTDLYGTYDVEPYLYSVDFRRQLKARAMKFKVPTQILLESTLTPDDELGDLGVSKTPLSDRAWNICTTLYYKAGGKPWRLSTAREGVCYVGIVFRKVDPAIGNLTACCAAQMFLDTGDGVVIRGEYGPWFSPKTGQFHISNAAARNLLAKVLKTYYELEGKPLREVFLHYRASISDYEYQGFRAACPPAIKLTCIRVRQESNEVRLFREGTRPVLRGTLLKINSSRGYLWTSGFKPFLSTYDGWEIPVPLRIDIESGDESITQVATDILGLTKLNFNECKYGDATPVTIGFSDAVGEILVSNPRIKDSNPRFKFYI